MRPRVGPRDRIRWRRAFGAKRGLVLAERLAVGSEQQRGFKKRLGGVGKIGRDIALHGAVGAAIVLLLAPVADADEDAETVRLQWKAGRDAAEQQNLFGSGLTDVREEFQSAPCLSVRPRQDGVEVAAELVERDASNLAPTEDAGFGSHSTALCQRQQDIVGGVANGGWVDANLVA